MTHVVSSIADLCDNLQAGLLAHFAATSGYQKVEVLSGPIYDSTEALESVQFDSTDADAVEWGLIGNRAMEEKYTLVGMLWVVRPGAGEAAIRAARRRAFDIIGEVKKVLVADSSVGGAVRIARLSAIEMDQGPTDGGRSCRLTFRVACEERLLRS